MSTRETGRPFVGRESEIALVRSAFAAASVGQGGLVLFHGDAGIGKTRLLEESAGAAAVAGASVRWGRCYERDGAPPFWPWLEVLRADVGGRDGADLRALLGDAAADMTHLMPEIRDRLPGLEPTRPFETPEGRFRIFESVLAVLARMAASRPLVIVLDDLQGADRSSLLLLEFTAQRLDGLPILVLAAHRDVEGGDAEHPLAETLAQLARAGTAESIALAGLERPAVADLIATTVAGPVTDALIDALHALTGGNPLFLGEIFADLGHHERTPSTAATVLPAGVHDAIARHVRGIAETTHEFLRVGSVLGREIVLPILSEVAELASATSVEALDEAVAAGLLIDAREPTGCYRFRHALIRDALYEAIEPGRRREIHRRVAEALARRPDEDEHLAEIAHHFAASDVSGEGRVRATVYARRAGDRALAMVAFEEAERLYRLALDLSRHRTGADTAERGALLLALGTAQSRAGDVARARETFVLAAEHGHATGSRALVAAATLGYGGELAFPEGGARDDRHIALLEAAIAPWGDEDATLHARLLVHLAMALYFTDAAGRRVALCDRALAMARRLGDEDTLAEVLLGTHHATSGAGNARERLGVADALLRLANRRGDRRLAFHAHAARLWDHLEIGAMAGFDADLDACGDLAREFRQPSFDGLVIAFTAARATLKGRFEEAETLTTELLASGRWLGAAAEAFFTLQLMMIRYLQGRLGEILEPIRTVVSMSPGIVGARCGLALCHLQLGRVAEARETVLPVLTRSLLDLPRNGPFLPTVVQLAEVCAAVGDREHVQIVYDALLPHAASCAVIPNAIAFVGAVSHYLGLLARALGDDQAAARHFEQALLTHGAMGAEPWLALTQLEYGVLLVTNADRTATDRGEGLITQAGAAAEALGIAALTARVQAFRTGRTEFATARTVLDDARRSEDRADDGSEGTVFRVEGDFWTIGYGGRPIRLRDTRGLRYLAQLLWHPGREFHASELVQLASGMRPAGNTRGDADAVATATLGDAGETIDDRARREYRRHLDDLREQLLEAEERSDIERASRLRAEMQTVAHMLGSTPRGRRVAAHAERARLTVTKGIKAALDRVRTLHPELARHLAATIRRGYVCVYVPDPRHPVEWRR